MQIFDLKVSWSPIDVSTPMRILKKMSSFSQDTWDGVTNIVSAFTSETSNEIRGNRVSKGTYSWRRGYDKIGKNVETYRGQKQLPNVSWTMGGRTGTFLDAYANLEEPGVTIWKGVPWEGVKRKGYGVPIENGAFSIQINADQFAQIKNSSWGGYPNFFQDYLVGKGILPKLGFLHIPGPVQDTIMHELSSKVEKHWSRICKEV